MPVESFLKSMEYLDDRRLGKQRVEAAQILEILTGQPFLPKNMNTLVPFEKTHGAWRNHPAVEMWRHHEEWLKYYLAFAIGEWSSRGFTNNILIPNYSLDSQIPPSFIGCEAFHASHRSNLLRKMPGRYREFWPDEPSDLPYYWPTKQ